MKYPHCLEGNLPTNPSRMLFLEKNPRAREALLSSGRKFINMAGRSAAERCSHEGDHQLAPGRNGWLREGNSNQSELSHNSTPPSCWSIHHSWIVWHGAQRRHIRPALIFMYHGWSIGTQWSHFQRYFISMVVVVVGHISPGGISLSCPARKLWALSNVRSSSVLQDYLTAFGTPIALQSLD